MNKSSIDGITDLILAEQTQVLSFHGELDEKQAHSLEQDIKYIDYSTFVDHIRDISNDSHKKSDSKDVFHKKSDINKVLPPSNMIVDGYGVSTEMEMNLYFNRGLEMISKGQVGVVILAGGQGT